MFQFCIAGVHAQFVTLSDSSLLPAASTACQVSGEPTGVQGRGTVRVRVGSTCWLQHFLPSPQALCRLLLCPKH